MKARMAAFFGSVLAVCILAIVFAAAQASSPGPGGDRYSAATLVSIARIKTLYRPRAVQGEMARQA